MLIIGAKGFAKEVLEILHQLDQIENLAFFDDVSSDLPEKLYDRFPILHNESEVKSHFKGFGTNFALGIGNPIIRKVLCEKIEKLGGTLVSIISPASQIGSYNVTIEAGCIILPYSVIANNTSIGRGCIVYYNTLITHDCKVGEFVELSPSVTLLGGSKIGANTQIGANVTILPKIEIGENVIIGAGSVVTKNIPNNYLAIGIPAKTTKKL